MLKQRVDGEIPIVEPAQEIDRQRPGRFDMPVSERNHRLERDLRNHRTKFAEQEIEFNEIELTSAEKLNSAISSIRKQSQSEIQRLRTEQNAANNRLDKMAAVGEITIYALV